ncbi:hypothetical protein AK812_SmicGene7355 [Symbiodinium microadriaticum]|uniref:Uncharacterized protein n=1 Tax=Symbiodinium microadriaticum TaxID=2951 RepID=A0A1Q9ENQ5_SYMMI|nr:hypothetical protein AK812_SmicGene7355 [Symbiodinium microadriaticum]
MSGIAVSGSVTFKDGTAFLQISPNFDLIEPLFNHDHMKDKLAVMKRASFFVFSDSGLFIRLPSEKHDKPFFNNYKSGIVTYGPDYEQEVRQEQEMIDASRARLSSFGRVHDYISHVNGEIQKWLTPVRHLPASPESSDHEEPSRADFGLPPVFHPIGTTNRPSRLGTFLYPGADKKRHDKPGLPKKGKFRAALKRPSSVKYAVYKSVPYTRLPGAVPERGQRGDQTKWRRSIKDILNADNKSIVDMLTDDKIIPDWTGAQCPRCTSGKLSGLVQQRPGAWKYRCNRKHCQAYLNPHHLHPLFVDADGSGSSDLQTQSAMLLLKLTGAPTADFSKILHVNHKFKQKTMKLGDGHSWMDVEGDEATFTKTNEAEVAGDKSKPIRWEQWLGFVERGRPDSLILERLNPPCTYKRAPGPGAIRRVEWKPLAMKHLRNRRVVFHTDSAKSYKLRVDGVVHDRVVHAKKRVLVNGKFILKAPTYVKVVEHRVPGRKKPLRVKAGTQIIDRAWRFMKDRISLNQHTRTWTLLLRNKIRSAQYQYWKRGFDLWLETGNLCTWVMQNFVHPM